MAKQKVLILGGGFGGVKAALELCHDSNFEVELISDQADFRFYPALFESAVGRSDSASSIPLTEIFAGHEVRLTLASAQKLNRGAKVIQTKDGQKISYDILIIALGSVTNFFGIKGLEQFAYGVKTLEAAKKLRGHIHDQLTQGHPDTAYVVIGGGPTGIELAGSLPSYIDHVMLSHGLPPTKVHIDLVEAAPQLLPRMSATYAKAVTRRLTRLGINLYLNQAVSAETADGLMVSGHSIKSHSVVWTAGVANNPFLASNDFKMDDHHKVAVDQHLQAGPNIYVIGDNAGTEFSGMAQTALYDAKFVAANLKRQVRGKSLKAYKPKRPVYVIPAGPGWAAVQWGRFSFYGRLGWWLRAIADLVAYHDLEPFWKASKHWLAERRDDDSCEVCTRN